MLRGLIVLLAAAFTFNFASANPKLFTTSNKLKEFGYVIRGTIQIPTNTEAYYASYLLDVVRGPLDHPTDAAAIAEAENILSSPARFKEKFDALYADRLPIVNSNGELLQSKLSFWVANQLLFTANRLKEHGVSITLRQLLSSKIVARTTSTITVNYEAFTVGIVDKNKNGHLDLVNNPITQGMRFLVPKSAINFYFKSMGPEFQSFLAQVQADVKQNRLDNLVARVNEVKRLLVLTTKNQTGNKCLEPDGDHVSPISFSYYYNDAFAGCIEQAPVAPLQVKEVKALEVKTTYPEYHRLFADNRVDLFIYYNAVNGEEVRASASLEQTLTRRGYIQDPSFTMQENHKRYVMDIQGITMAVEWVVAGPGDKEAFHKAISSQEIIIYDGHAGYGAQIDDFFTKESSYPNGKYQIIFLNGCSTYKYGMTTLLDVKALRDLDFYYQNVDVVATYSSVSGHQQHLVMIDVMEKVIPYFKANVWNTTTVQQFKDKFSWLPIITKINEVSDLIGKKDNGMFLVSGEDFNDYEPGKTTFRGMKEPTAEELIAFIGNVFYNDSSRLTALKVYNKKFLRVNGLFSVADANRKARSVCESLLFKQGMASVLGSEFFLPQCQVKRLELEQDTEYKGRIYSGLKPILFHPSGVVKKAQLAQDTKIGPYTATQRTTIAFFDNGAIQFFSPKNDFSILNTRLEVKSHTPVEMHPNGSVKSVTIFGTLEFRGLKFVSGLEFYENGLIKSGTISGPFKLAGFSSDKSDAYTTIEYYPDGKLKQIAGSHITSVRPNLKLPETGYKSITFHLNGHYKFITSQEQFLLKGMSYTSLMLREDRSVVYVASTRPIQTPRIPCRTSGQYDGVMYDRSGTVVFCNLAQNFEVNGQRFNAGDPIVWTADNRLLSFNDLGALQRYFQEIGADFTFGDTDREDFENNW